MSRSYANKLCSECHNLLLPGVELICTGCGTKTPIDPRNNMISEYKHPVMSDRFTSMLSSIHMDPTSLKSYATCKRCGDNITIALLGDSDHVKYVCRCDAGPDFDINGILLMPPNVSIHRKK